MDKCKGTIHVSWDESTICSHASLSRLYLRLTARSDCVWVLSEHRANKRGEGGSNTVPEDRGMV